MARLAFVPLFILLSLIIGSLLSLIFKLNIISFIDILFDKEIMFALELSVSTALISLSLSIFCSIPAAWALVRSPFKGKRIIDFFLDIPIVTPPFIAGLGLLILLGHNGFIGHHIPPIAQNLFSPLGVVIAQTYVGSALLVRSSIASFSSLDLNYVHAAYNLGLSPLKTFILVEIPMCWRTLMGGCILALARILGEFGATLMLAGAIRSKTETIPMAVYLNIASGDFQVAIASAVLLIAFSGFLLMFMHFIQRSDHGLARSS